MEAARMAQPATGDAESLTSMKKNGAIKIGGGIDAAAIFVHRDEDPTQIHGENDDIDVTSCEIEADLKFEIAANKNVKAMIKIDLEDDAQQMEEAYLEWTDVMGTGIKLAVGKKEIKAWGQDKIIFYEGGLNGGDSNILETPAGSPDGSRGNQHDQVGTNNWMPSEIDNAWCVEASYAFNDIAKLTGTLFQNAAGQHEDRPDDSLFFESFAVKLELMPFDGFKGEISFINRHNDSMGDEDFFGNDAEEDTYALSVGFTYKAKSVPVEIFAEWIHTWDNLYNDEQYADCVQLGLVWGVTENIDLGIQGEWAQIDTDDVAVGAYDDEDYYSISLSAVYNFETGIYTGIEYTHHWFDGDRRQADDLDADGDQVALVTGWTF
jgi:hypothetical protein